MWHSLSLVVMVCDPSLLHYMLSMHRKLRCICQGICMLLSYFKAADVRHRARSPLTFRHMALSKLLHAEDHTHAGVVIDGPEDMKPLVEAFAKQVCLHCYIPRHACEAFSSRKPVQSSAAGAAAWRAQSHATTVPQLCVGIEMRCTSGCLLCVKGHMCT